MNVAVIADDLTGAAELASAAADLGFTAEVHTRFDPTSTAQVIAVDTDSRTLPPEDAAKVVGNISGQILLAKPNWIYKKTDSVLRGNVRAEIEAILEVSGMQRAVYVPANPSKGRIIRQGQYSVGGKPLHETAFANDPHHPRQSSDVLELLGASARIAMPDAEHTDDLKSHAAGLGEQTLAAGGVEFFRAVLEHRIGLPASTRSEVTLTGPVVFICGSPQACMDGRFKQFEQREIEVLPMPRSFTVEQGPDVRSIARWSKKVVEAVRGRRRAAVVIDAMTVCGAPAEALSFRLALGVAEVLQSRAVATACIEGGATAAAVLTELQITRLRALSTRSLPGVAAMESASHLGLTFLVKPGSYAWPDEVLGISGNAGGSKKPPP